MYGSLCALSSPHGVRQSARLATHVRLASPRPTADPIAIAATLLTEALGAQKGELKRATEKLKVVKAPIVQANRKPVRSGSSSFCHMHSKLVTVPMLLGVKARRRHCEESKVAVQPLYRARAVVSLLRLAAAQRRRLDTRTFPPFRGLSISIGPRRL